MSSYGWDIKGFDRDTAVGFCRNGLNPLVSVFLASRGVSDINDARKRAGDIPGDIYDPFLMADMRKAVERINTALINSERIAVYGDYDVDGMTSCAIVALWLRSKNADFEVYIPDRIEEGYGINREALDELRLRGVKLVITVDCGITAIEEAKHAQSIGLDLVITDHHECRAELPDAVAVVDPKQPGCNYPNKDLAGVGVAFKLICALEHDAGIAEMIDRFGDFVAVGTVADVMPISEENRELIRRGLKSMNASLRPCFLSLLQEACQEHNKITAATVGYYIAPRLNAAGRMGQNDIALKLLLADDLSEVERLAGELCLLNSKRREEESGIYEEADALASQCPQDEPIIIAQHRWHRGVTGIVASKIAAHYKVPAIIISIGDNGIGRASCRSTGKFGIYEAITSCKDILIAYGGHETAAGVSIEESKIGEFKRRIIGFYREKYPDGFMQELHIDFEVEKAELLTIKNIDALKSLEPYGNSNQSPCLCIKNAELTSLQSIGDGRHTRLRIEKSGCVFDCIYFSKQSDSLGVAEGISVDMAFEPQINEFRGRTNVQLLVLGIRPSQFEGGYSVN